MKNIGFSLPLKRALKTGRGFSCLFIWESVLWGRCIFKELSSSFNLLVVLEINNDMVRYKLFVRSRDDRAGKRYFNSKGSPKHILGIRRADVCSRNCHLLSVIGHGGINNNMGVTNCSFFRETSGYGKRYFNSKGSPKRISGIRGMWTVGREEEPPVTMFTPIVPFIRY